MPAEQTTAQLEALGRECGYDEEEECSVDALIAYKNALEELAYAAPAREARTRIGELVLDWAGEVDPERFIEALGNSSVPEACETIGSAMRERDR